MQWEKELILGEKVAQKGSKNWLKIKGKRGVF